MEEPMKILHLEDNKNDAELVKEILSINDIDCSISLVDNKKDFIKLLNEKRFSLILADYNLPAFDGLTALKIALEKKPELPFIFMSGVLGEELAIETLKQGATDYVLKARPERLVPAIRRAMREKEEQNKRLLMEREIVELEQKIKELETTYDQLTKRVRGFLKIELPSAKYILVDKFLEDLSGYPIGDWQETPNFIRTIIHPDYTNDYDDYFKQMLNGIVPKTIEYRIIRKDGEERWWIQFNIGAFDIEGKLTSISAVIVDITEDKETQLQYQRLFETALMGVYRTDIDSGEFIEANQKIATILGCKSIEELKKNRAIDFYCNPNDRRNSIEMLLKNGYSDQMEVKLKRKDGKIIWVRESARIYPKKGYIEGMMSDITERIEADQTLRANEEKYRSLFNEMPVGIITVNTMGDIQAINNHGLTLLQFESKTEALATNFFDYPLGKKIGIASLLQTCIEDNQKITSELDYALEDTGEIQTFLYKFIPMLDTNGKVTGAQCAFEDITELKKAEIIIKQKLEFEEAVSRVSSTFVKTIDIDKAIDKSLSILANVINCHRIYIFQYDEGQITFSNTHEWCAKGVNSHLRDFQQVPVKKHQYFEKILLERKVLNMEDVSQISDSLKAMRKFLLQRKATAILMVPFSMKGEAKGLIGVDYITGARTWSEDVIALLHVFANILGTSLERNVVEKQRNQLVNILTNSEEVVISADEKGIINYANPAVKKVFGYTPNELIGNSIEVFSPLGGVDQSTVIQEVLAQNKKMTFESTRKHKDGSLIPVIITLVPLKDEKTEAVSINAIIVDISDLKQLEQSVKTQAREFAILNRITSAGIRATNLQQLFDFILDSILRYLDFSGGAIYLLDKTGQNAILQRSLGWKKDLVEHLDKMPIQSNPFANLFSKGDSVIINNFQELAVENSLSKIKKVISVPFLSKQKVIGALMVSTQIDSEIGDKSLPMLESIGREIGTAVAKLQAEEDLVQFEKNLKKILNVIDEFLLVVDIETGSILEVNDVTIKTLGYSYKELLEMTYLNLHPLHVQDKAKRIFLKVANGELNSFVLPLQTKNGKEIVKEFTTYLQNLSGRRTIIGLSKKHSTDTAEK